MPTLLLILHTYLLIHTKPKILNFYIFLYRVGKEPPPEPASPVVISTVDGGFETRPSRHDTPLSGSRSGQILWIRGLTRLQTQVGFLLHVCVLTSYYTHLHR